MLTESQVFEDETLPGTESADHPPQEISEQHDHGKNLIGTNPNSAFGQVTHFAGVRYFGETQDVDANQESIRRFVVCFQGYADQTGNNLRERANRSVGVP